MNESWYFRCAGLAIESVVDIPEWAPFAIPSVPQPDVRIEWEPFNPELPSIDKVIDSGREVWLVVAGVSLFRIAGGRNIIAYPLPGVPRSQWLPFLLGSAWNTLCLQRGLLMLHAAVLAGPNGAYAFCGPSGAGKSTLAAQLTSLGMFLLSDDLCRVEPGPTSSLVYPSSPRLRLWGGAVRALGGNPSALPRVLDGRDKYLLQVLGNPIRDPVPLRGIFLLEWGEPEVIRIRGLQALSNFIREASYRPGVIEEMGMGARHWEQCLRLLRTVPLQIFRRSKEAGCLNSVTELMSCLMPNGLTEP